MVCFGGECVWVWKLYVVEDGLGDDVVLIWGVGIVGWGFWVREVRRVARRGVEFYCGVLGVLNVFDYGGECGGECDIDCVDVVFCVVWGGGILNGGEFELDVCVVCDYIFVDGVVG